MRIQFANIEIPDLFKPWDHFHSYSRIDEQFKEIEISENFVRAQKKKALNSTYHKITDKLIQYLNKNRFICIKIL